MPRALRRTLAALSATLAGVAAPPSMAAEPPGSIFGVRLGVPLAEQMPACAIARDGHPERRADGPCWTSDPRSGGRTARLSMALFAEIGMISIRELRESGGEVVEVDIEFPNSLSSAVERYLRRTRGAPSESERYERGSRVFGVRSLMTHTWRAGGVTLHFDERSASDQGRIRAYLDRWAADERARSGG